MFDLREHALADAGMPGEKNLLLRRPLDANADRITALLYELIGLGTRSFLFSGSGEPFLHQNILDFMALVKERSGTCLVNTNGTLLTPQVIDALVDIGVDELEITTMAGTSDMYMKTHPGSRADLFESIEGHLGYLVRRKQASGTAFPAVNLIFILVSSNADGLPDFIEFAGRVKADRITLRPVDSIDDPGLREIVPAGYQADSVGEQLRDVQFRLKALGISHNLPYFRHSFDRQLNTVSLYRRIPCYYGWIRPRVEVDGNVYPCCRCFESMGNVNQSSFRDIWQGSLYRQFRRAALGINKRRTPVDGCSCGTCPHYAANLRVYKALHPLKRHILDETQLPPGEDE